MFPPVTSEAAYFELWKRSDVWESAKNAICEREGLSPGGFGRQFDGGGSHIVWLDPGQGVIKLHSPYFPDAPVEQAVLEFMEGRLSVETPRLLGRGQLEGWDYTVSSFMTGVPMRRTWPELDRASRTHIAAQLGEVVREWHDVSAGYDIIEPGDWQGFIAARRANSVKLQEGSGLSDDLVRQVLSFLGEVDSSFTDPQPPALLHTDFRRVHVLMTESGGRWRISGLIDVGDSMMGHREYDLIKATHAVGPPDREVLRALFRGYGECGIEMSRAGSERMMRWSLLHPDTPLAAYLEGAKLEPGADMLAGLAAQIWPLE